jgi:cytochrome c oxidase cbb3-type subunit 3
MPEPIDQLRDHAFDGIQEYDNDLPRWWLMLFYGSIVWAALYVVFYHVMGVPVGASRWDVEEVAQRQERARVAAAAPTEEILRAQLTDRAVIARGAQVYAEKLCASCHGPDGASSPAGIGLNLVDRHFKHGNRMLDMLGVIQNGAGAMVAQRLAPADANAVVAWIVDQAKQGGKPGKAPGAGEVEQPIDY